MAIITATAVFTWMLLIIVLHFLKPEFNPATRMCSEYAIGKYGWLMQTAFYSLAVGSFILTFVLWPQLHHFGVILLALIGFCFVGAGVFKTDPVFATEENKTLSGGLHNLFAAIAIPLFPVMATTLTIDIQLHSIWKNNWIVVFAVLVCIGCIGFLQSVFRAANKQSLQDKKVPIGYYQRFMIFAMSCWLIAVALSTTTV